MPAEATVASTPTDLAPDKAAGTARPWTLALACVAMFMLMLDVTVVNVALQDLRTSLDAGFAGLQWVIDSYTLTLAAFLLTGGSLADRLGRKRVFLAGLVLFTLSSLAAGLAQDVLTLNIARGVQGAGAALLFSVGPALIGHEFRGADRGKAFGLFGAIAGLALALGPLVGGLLTDSLSWRWIFLVNVPIGVLALVAGLLRLRESREPSAHRVDWAGMTAFGLGLALIVLGFLRGEADGWTSAPILAAFAAGLILLAAFVLVEKRLGERAMFDLTLLRNPTFTAVCCATLLSNATSLAAVFLQISYVQNVLGYSPWDTGLRFMPMMITLFVVSAITGGLLAKVSPGLLIGLSIGLIALGMGLMVLVDADSSWTAMLPSMIVTGVGMGLFNPPRAAVTIGVVRPEKAGMASGMGETFQQVGVAVGVAAFGALFHHKAVDAFTATDAGGALGAGAHEVGRSVATGGTSALGDTVAPGRLEAVTEAARTAFVDSLSDVMVLCALFAAVGAAIAFAGIRRRDLHESAQAPDPAN
ncbi:major facilitator superfamily MFS1 [Streptomyces albus]|uniref:Major facilitator superfamily MFS1 n=1 Tax=Streptomyces albus (strain ATCC 21838 / DSM 41398 / FERM P-419 / JCM 4703 / NBRC 107858) TaxID=1081613 RepID=A0A0B5EEV5_STRA4|nr:major facilitator superfamily MFS1 [Streptomyces albus]AOU74808.1 major facilitator superfamily MFS_1 [Streptomyces albus]AYN30618.1 major facilitator superfamily MFS1 [Streptomyces albus]